MPTAGRRAGRGTFELLLPRLRLLLAARPYSSVMMVVNPDTAAHLTESVEFLLEEGARYLIVSLNHAGPWTEETLEILRAEYEKLAQRYVAWTRAGRKFYLSPFEVKLSSHINRHCYHKDRCELGRRQLSVDPDGWLYPCVQFVKGGPASRWCIGHVGTGVDEAARRADPRGIGAGKAGMPGMRAAAALQQLLRLPELADHRERQRDLADRLPPRADADADRRPRRSRALPPARSAFPAQALQRRLPGAVHDRGCVVRTEETVTCNCNSKIYLRGTAKARRRNWWALRSRGEFQTTGMVNRGKG